jgi:NADH-quinone oxidoreductase subunit E
MSQIDLSNIDRIIDVHESRREHLIHILQDISTECNYLPEDGLRRVATRLDVPLSRIYSMATFYRDFSLEPRGRHLIKVCVGSACYVKGAGRILEKLERDLRLTPGGTTEDMEFSLETVRCLGACSLAPMLVIDGDYYGQMTSSKIDSVMKKY